MKKEMLKSKNFFFNFFFIYLFFIIIIISISLRLLPLFLNLKKKQNKTNKTGSVLYNMWDALVCTIFGRRHLKKKNSPALRCDCSRFFFFFLDYI